jgi:uncharacterized alpha-E superfamily protein
MLLSSLAERVYWFARYVERVENTARIILVNNNLLMDTPRTITLGWSPIVSITGCAELFYEHHQEATEQNVMRFLVMDSHNPSCMLNTLSLARENLRTSRAIFPREIWETLNDLHNYVKVNKSTALSRRNRFDFLRHVIDSCHIISGKLSATMSHDLTYDFVRLGRNIERADMTTRVIDVRAENLLPKHTGELKPFDDIQWKSVLDSLDAYLVYRRCFRVPVRGTEVLRFLLKDTYFPRALTYCLAELDQCLKALPANETPLQILGKTKNLIEKADVAHIVGENLHDFIDALQLDLIDLHEKIATVYFQLPEDIFEFQEVQKMAASA